MIRVQPHAKVRISNLKSKGNKENKSVSPLLKSGKDTVAFGMNMAKKPKFLAKVGAFVLGLFGTKCMVGMFNRQSTVHLEDNGDNVSIDSNGRADEPQPTPPVKGVASRPTNQTLSLLPPPVKGVATRKVQQPAQQNVNRQAPVPLEDNGDNVSIDSNGRADDPRSMQPAQQNANKQTPAQYERMESISQAGLEPARNCCAIL